MTTNLPLVSIALCTYNGSKFIKEQLDSLLRQSYANIEIIAVDDCSTDETRDILTQYQILYPSIKVHFNTTNLGFNRNFEKAIALCSAEFIAISDQDDIWVETKISNLINAIGDFDLAYCNSLLIDSKGVKLTQHMFDNKNIYTGKDPRVFAIHNIISGHSMLFKKRIIKENHFPSTCYYDWWIVFLATNSAGVVGISEIGTYYRKHDHNVSSTWNGLSQKKDIVNYRDRIKSLLDIPNLKHRAFFEQLYFHFNNKVNSKFSPGLFLFICKHIQVLTLLSNKSIFSKLNSLRQKFL